MSDLSDYCGRFAPSPTGDLHFGSLVAAIASYCQAKAHQGQWLIRIEDIDETRTIPGADQQIIKTLKNFGMTSDQPIIFQTDPERQQAYHQALLKLSDSGLTYPCICTRKTLRNYPVYPGTCKNQTIDHKMPHSIRLVVPDQNFKFDDRFQGQQEQNINHQCGDFNIKRKDGLFCYQLAVVVDDADQGISEVVRGIDIMDSTARQMYLIETLGLEQPGYAHFPVVVNANGDKLSKQNHAKPVTFEDPLNVTRKALQVLQQEIPVLNTPSQTELLNFAVTHWQPQKLKGQQKIIY